MPPDLQHKQTLAILRAIDGANGADGSNGADGINGTNGNDGITPEFKIEDGKWFVSYNNKATWVELGQATGDKGEKGDKGDAGLNGTNGTNGTDGINGTNGKDGITPKLKIVDGYWYISYDGGVTYETEPLGKATGDKGANGTNGVDGKTPTFKVEGGVLFVSYDETTWKSLGLVKGVSGEAGKTPTMKIEGGDWYVSYDDGETWANLGQATGDKGANGTNGTNGITPTFKVEGGNLYVSYNEGASWSNLGNVKGADGANGTNGAAGKDGVTPKMKITDGYWYISYDNEKTWTKLDKATGANGVDGKTPELSINSEGHLISTVNGVATDLGNVTGATPVIKVEDGKWKVSTDGGTTWTEIAGSSTVGGDTSSTLFRNPISGYLDGYAYVDLGLPSGLKWATTNVGADYINEYGNYYAWGEISTASSNDYSGDNSITYGKTKSVLFEDGILDSNGDLRPEYDAATQNWSKNWRMPTKSEFAELKSNCKWTWTTLGGIVGYKVSSKVPGNDNWIFLTSAGFRHDKNDPIIDSYGCYWTSSFSTTSKASYFIFHSSYGDVLRSENCNYGMNIRPVCE
ncbi:MAG: DUF4988 domain-containing protein, partial [Paludibacteraceae bacterium]|nr:DUF4988 domain-containing protein [Paludibacteraceae bacterium]